MALGLASSWRGQLRRSIRILWAAGSRSSTGCSNSEAFYLTCRCATFICVQARGSDLRVHFKNTTQAAAAIRGLTLTKAKAYLDAVIDHKRCVPFLRFNGVWAGEQREQWPCFSSTHTTPSSPAPQLSSFLSPSGGVGRTSQAKNEGNKIGQGRWPKKSAEFLLNLLKNAESNAELKGLDTDALFISHIQVQGLSEVMAEECGSCLCVSYFIQRAKILCS